MEYTQQRRSRGGYGCGRPMNYGRPNPMDCGCDTGFRDTDCTMEPRSMGNNTGSANHCACPCSNSCTYKRQSGCLEESDNYPVGMGYVPWQRWSCPYDGHRGLMSGTIFPLLDKPFCVTGRCHR